MKSIFRLPLLLVLILLFLSGTVWVLWSASARAALGEGFFVAAEDDEEDSVDDETTKEKKTKGQAKKKSTGETKGQAKKKSTGKTKGQAKKKSTGKTKGKAKKKSTGKTKGKAKKKSTSKKKKRGDQDKEREIQDDDWELDDEPDDRPKKKTKKKKKRRKSDDHKEKDGGDGADGDVELSNEEKYVRELIQDYLDPESLKYLPGGRVEMTFRFFRRSSPVTRFTPPVLAKIEGSLRWPLRGETGFPVIRIARRGVTFLNCWFLGEVEAEVEYRSQRNFTKKQSVALIFGDKKNALGNNFGSQCVVYSRGKPKKKKGRVRGARSFEPFVMKLTVKDGEFQSYRGRKMSARLSYRTKRFKSGRVGFLWAGNVVGYLSDLRVKGRLDYQTMYEELRKWSRKR